MNTIVVEKENKIKSGVSTALLVIFMGLLLWVCKINIEMPIIFPEVATVEMIIEPQTGSDGGKNNSSETFIPVATSKQNLEETANDYTVKQEKIHEPVSEVPIDNSIEQMKNNREKARQKTKVFQGNHKDNYQAGNEGDYKGPGDGAGKIGPGVSSTFSGRSFLGGNTSIDCHESGQVVLEVELLPNGKIIFIDVDPATNGSDCLVKAAKEILEKSSFNASAKPRSNGIITFIFKLN
jgi:hypothetical protein